MKWVPVRSSHLCIENEKAGGLPVRQLMVFTVDSYAGRVAMISDPPDT